MPENIIQIDQNLLETRPDRLVAENMTQILNVMLDAETNDGTGVAYTKGEQTQDVQLPAITTTQSQPRAVNSNNTDAVNRTSKNRWPMCPARTMPLSTKTGI